MNSTMLSLATDSFMSFLGKGQFVFNLKFPFPALISSKIRFGVLIDTFASTFFHYVLLSIHSPMVYSKLTKKNSNLPENGCKVITVRPKSST